MLSRDPQFRKLKIKARSAGGSATYWLGPDHLLIVTVDGYNERYRRIYFRDVQAIIIRRTSTWIWMAVVMSLLLILAGILPISTGQLEGYIFGGIMITVVGVILVAHLIAGPTCGCRVVTAVQNRDLPHLNRWKPASRLLEALQAEVNRVQQPAAQATSSDAVETAAPPTDQPVT